MFTRDGVFIAGAMGEMGDMKANDAWSLYLATDDMAKALESAESLGGQVIQGAMPVADLGIQAVLLDPTGANLGAWQPGSFPGITVLGEHGAPSWFELRTRDYATALDFYRSVFSWDTATVGDTDEFRYSVMRDPSGEGELAGIFDASGFLPETEPSKWWIYFQVDDIDAALVRLASLGGSVVTGAEDSPYGRIATVADPAGAKFKLHTPNT